MTNAAVGRVRDVVPTDGNNTSPTSTVSFYDIRHMGQWCWLDHPGEVGSHFSTRGVIHTRLMRSSSVECPLGRLEDHRGSMLLPISYLPMLSILSLGAYVSAIKPWKPPAERIKRPARPGCWRGKTLWKRGYFYYRHGTQSQACVTR
jgi:hypothetical protein